MTNSVVVTGASGFIGSALVAELLERGISVYAVSRRRVLKTGSLKTAIVNKYDETPCPANSTIIHLAETSNSAAANTSGKQYVAEVKQQTSALLAKKFDRFIYVSSGTVYRKGAFLPRLPTSETLSENIYTEAKIAAEGLVRRAGGVIVRLSNIYGPPPKPGTVIADILNQIPGEGPLRIKDVASARDYLWIGDAAKGLNDIALGATAGVFNLGTGIETTAGDLAKIALAHAGQPERQVVASINSEPDSTDSIALDATSTTHMFGWKPTICVDEGISLLFEGPYD
jgi:nucleoside-diphosphate-sugar epimerase